MRKCIFIVIGLLLSALLTTALFSACGKQAQEAGMVVTAQTKEASDEETTAAESTTAAEDGDRAFPDATADELSALGDAYSAKSLLNACTDTFFENEDPHYSAEFTGKMTAKEMKAALFLGSRCPLYEFYFGKPETVEFAAGSNPLETAADETRTYAVYSEKNMNAMLQKLLRLDGVTAGALADAAGGDTRFFCQDGKLYLAETARVSSKAPYAVAEETSRLRDGRYRVSVHYALFEDETMVDLDGQGELIAGIVTVDGERHWAIFSYSAFLQREQPAEDAAGGDAETKPAAANTAADAYKLLGESADAVVKAYGSDYKEKTANAIVYDTPGMRVRLSGGKVSAVTLWGSAAVYGDLRADMTAKELTAMEDGVEIEEYDDAAEATFSLDGYQFLYVWENYGGEGDAAARVTISKE